MVIHKEWLAGKGEWPARREWRREGWFLFGLIPLYIRDIDTRGRK